jgi:phosphoglycolate phosphatase
MKTLIFDMDGTLADSIEVALDVAHDITGLPRLSDEEIARLRKMPPLKILRELKIPLHQIPKLASEFRRRMHERIEEVKPCRGVPTALKKLDQQDCHMLVMSSNSEKNVRSFLRTNHLEHYFSGVYGGVGLFGKSAALKRVMRRNKLTPKACYYIGDEVRDITSAKKAGVPVVVVSWGFQDAETLRQHNPDKVLAKPAELLNLIDGEIS